MGGGGGVTSDELTAKASDVLQGKTYMGADTGDEAGAGGIPIYSGRTITPGIANQIIAAGQYLGGDVTVAGSSNLTAANIKSGVNLFGVVGSCHELRYISKTFTSSGDRKQFYNTGSAAGSYYYLTIPNDFDEVYVASARRNLNDISNATIFQALHEHACFVGNSVVDMPTYSSAQIIMPVTLRNTAYIVQIVGY